MEGGPTIVTAAKPDHVFVSKHYRGESAGEAYDTFETETEEQEEADNKQQPEETETDDAFTFGLTPTSSTTSLQTTTPENALYSTNGSHAHHPLQQQHTNGTSTIGNHHPHHHNLTMAMVQQDLLQEERASREHHVHSTIRPLRKTPQEQSSSSSRQQQQSTTTTFVPTFLVSKFLQKVSRKYIRRHSTNSSPSTWIGFWALLLVTCANYVLQPMRDAIALAVGVRHIPKLTLASTVLAVVSSVPIGWLFEAPDPQRRRVWKRMGLTRGDTQGTSLALFYRMFAFLVTTYAIGFQLVDYYYSRINNNNDNTNSTNDDNDDNEQQQQQQWSFVLFAPLLGQFMYVAFFLVVHLMKLHSLSLVWGVTTEAMEYEDVARKRMMKSNATVGSIGGTGTTIVGEGEGSSNKSRLQRMAFVGFGGTMGGILGSLIASSLANVLHLSGLLLVAAVLLEASAELSIELGRIMQKHWEEQQLFKSTDDLAALDSSMKRSVSLGSMKRVASGNSLHKAANHKSFSDLANAASRSHKSFADLASACKAAEQRAKQHEPPIEEEEQQQINDDSFSQRLMRGITTILRSRLLMAIFTYNALYASTTVLLSFQRATLVANRNVTSSTESDTAFLANINMASSIAVFVLQLSGVGAYVAHQCGSRGTLALMPLMRLMGVFALAWWHRISDGMPPNLILFLLLDECTRVMNLAVAKPVRESLWRGLSNEARYEAKPIVDTLANRWGGGSAAFLVSLTDKILDIMGVGIDVNGGRSVLGFPPILFLCMIVAAWWAMVSADLGNIRRRIDLELKKQQ